MINPLPTFFDHSRHTLTVRGIEATLDVLAFDGEEQLSQPFKYRIEFTSSDHDIAASDMLKRQADFSLHAAPHDLPPVMPWDSDKITPPLRTLHGVITGFKRLSGSNDEARYEITLQPRLALLERGRQFRIYQHQSVPQIVESILRSRHEFEGQDFLFNLVREYPRREQVMQYGEDDLTFIRRLLAEVGIWFRFTVDQRLRIDVVEFHDDQRHYAGDVQLPYRTQSGLGSSGVDAVWQLQTEHQVVEQNVNVRAYHHRDIYALLDGDVDQTRGDQTLYGEAYHYAEPYTVLGDRIDQDEDLLSESGFFYARLRHERYLNKQTRLSGVSSSPTLALAQVLKISGGAPQAFAPGAVITRLITRAARDRSFEVSFEAMSYAETICFRPPLLPKPQITGTVPARVTSTQAQDIYSHIDREGRYTVSFLFDRDSWKPGEESLWLRLARPYAGDTHGLHLPLICGTEVAIAFEQGDPDRPYIAHALHDNKHKDHVTLDKRDYTRNVLRTPANNKLRMEDLRGQEHVKLSTEYGGKSQLNLGHLVDAQKQKRGEGFELRTDGWGAIRGGKGVFISADEQAKAQGQQLEMDAAIGLLQQAGDQLKTLSVDATAANADPADVQAQINLLRQDLEQLKSSVLLLSAPQGIALTSGKHLQLAAQNNLMLNAGSQADISVVKRMFIGVGEGLSVFVRKLGVKLLANHGPVTIQAQNDTLEILARQGLNITSTDDEIHITAKKKIILNAGGSYITMDQCGIESGTVGDYTVKSAHNEYLKEKAKQVPQLPDLPVIASAAPVAPLRVKSLPVRPAANPLDDPGKPDDPVLHDDLDEEEEEEELEGITLRLGLFFDGTGNNLSNSATTAQCQREDLQLFSSTELASIVAYCGQYGFSGFDGNWFDSTPDTSYGNAASNVVHLHRLYPDHATDGLPAEADIGYVPVYVEGIGTRSGGKDSRYGQATGRGETGVVARVEQAPALIKERLDLFQRVNPGIKIRRVEFDIFGFSRGAAAARHCANELLKPGCGIFAELLKPNRFGLLPTFNPARHVSLNLIGLFDTVAAIAAPGYGDLSVANADNSGVNLYLPPGCARKIIQLQARDETRHNFALNSLQRDHQQISLPGVHSDVGGGYLPRAREKVLLTTPQRVDVKVGRKVESTPEWAAAEARADTLRATGLAGEGSINVKAIPFEVPPQGKKAATEQNYMISVELDRPVRGELALIALRLMRELGVRHGVPFKNLDAQPELAVPADLKLIAARILENVLAGTAINLDTDQERLLLGRYIHVSAHWTPVGGLFINKPAQENRRIVHPDYPQLGYPK
jgi:type VI secretion system secreted protein VgrG